MSEDILVIDFLALPERAMLIDSRSDIPQDRQKQILTRFEIIGLVDQTGLDLIRVNPGQEPAVFKLVDWGKLKYDQQRKQREQQRKQRESSKGLKEFYFTPGMSQHDYQVRLKHVIEALPQNDVRIGMKVNRKTKDHLGVRGTPDMTRFVRDPEFILNRVLRDLGSLVQPASLFVGERQVSTLIKGV